MPDIEHESLFCRVCFCGPDPEMREAGQLISPCSCTGSVSCIHLHCLRTWQATQRAQGRSLKSQSCELCGSKYVISQKLLQQERCQLSYLERVQNGLKWAWQWCNHTAQGPMWQEALRYWRNALLVWLVVLPPSPHGSAEDCIMPDRKFAVQIAGLYKATLWGIVGLAAGGKLGINSASRGAQCLARLAPGFMVTALLFPRLQASQALHWSNAFGI